MRRSPTVSLLVPDALVAADIVGNLLGHGHAFTAEPVATEAWPHAWAIGFWEEATEQVVATFGELVEAGTMVDVIRTDTQENA